MVGSSSQVGRIVGRKHRRWVWSVGGTEQPTAALPGKGHFGLLGHSMVQTVCLCTHARMIELVPTSYIAAYLSGMHWTGSVFLIGRTL
eukprot:1137446-Pelagomonas_calceolata.AAC.9